MFAPDVCVPVRSSVHKLSGFKSGKLQESVGRSDPDFSFFGTKFAPVFFSIKKLLTSLSFYVIMSMTGFVQGTPLLL